MAKQFEMKHKIVRISSRGFIAAAILFLTFRHRFSGSVLEISEAENDPLDQNVKVSKLSEKNNSERETEIRHLLQHRI